MPTALAPLDIQSRCRNFEVVIPISPRQRTDNSSLATAIGDDGDELSDEAIAQLLGEAEERLRGGAPTVSIPNENKYATIRLPKLDPGSSFPKPPINSQRGISRIRDQSRLVPERVRALADSARPIGDDIRKRSKKEPPPTAGAAWFDMPRTELTAEFKRDFEIIKHRNVLDPHRHYRKDKSGIPEYSQVGTVIEGNTEFFNSRINRKDRKKTILEEVMADSTSRDRFKRKYNEIQQSKKSGKKEFYKKLKEQRKKIKFAE